MRICKRCRELGRICAACAIFLFGAHDLHNHEDQKQGPPREVRNVTIVASTTSNLSATEWIIVPGASKWFRFPPPST
jgi:hypothetical protein